MQTFAASKSHICSIKESQRLLTVFDSWHHATVKRVLNALPVILIYVPVCAFCPTLYFSILSPSFFLSSLLPHLQQCLLSSLTFIPLLSLFPPLHFPLLSFTSRYRERGRERESARARGAREREREKGDRRSKKIEEREGGRNMERGRGWEGAWIGWIRIHGSALQAWARSDLWFL